MQIIKSAMLRFDKLLGETPKAYLIKYHNEPHWIPKSLCRDFITNKKLGGNVVLPTFIINKIIGTNIENVDLPLYGITPHWVVEHHEPERKEPVSDNTIKRLIK